MTVKNDSIAVRLEAARTLAGGSLVGMPTETVYGLAADAANDLAVARIFEVKGRPSFNPLIVHVLDEAMAENLGILDTVSRSLMEAFWPGPLTIVVPRLDSCPASRLVSAGLDTIALRAPAHPTARAVLASLGHPFAAPSANPSGRLSPTRAEHVDSLLGDKLAFTIDAGPCTIGLESTVVTVQAGTIRILRPGSIGEAALTDIAPIDDSPGTGVEAPGMLTSHYAPNARLRLNATKAQGDEALLGFGPVDGATLNLSPTANLIEAAANLFSCLHRLDADHQHIAVSPIPNTGLGIAINDRLSRAAAG